jgi:hypothetical protein
MKNIYEVLRQKELQISQLEKEVEALRVVAPLLSEDKQDEAASTERSRSTAIPKQASPTGTEGSARRWP